MMNGRLNCNQDHSKNSKENLIMLYFNSLALKTEKVNSEHQSEAREINLLEREFTEGYFIYFVIGCMCRIHMLKSVV